MNKEDETAIHEKQILVASKHLKIYLNLLANKANKIKLKKEKNFIIVIVSKVKKIYATQCCEKQNIAI